MKPTPKPAKVPKPHLNNELKVFSLPYERFQLPTLNVVNATKYNLDFSFDGTTLTIRAAMVALRKQARKGGGKRE